MATDDDFFLAAQDFDAAPLNTVGDVVMGRALFGKILGTATLTLNIVTHVLATGGVSVYVAYIEGA